MISKEKILFSHSYFYPLDAKQWSNKTPYPPLGTIWAASVMREAGFEVDLFDTNLRSAPNDIKEALTESTKYFVIYDDGFNYLTKMCLTNMRDAATEMIQIAKKKGKIVLVCSSDSTDHYKKYMANGADVVILGEGEETLKETLNTLRDNRPITTAIKGIAFFEGESVVKSPPRAVLKDLDTLPFPAWDLINMEAYRKVWKRSKYTFTLNIATTRGCPFKCNWCAKPIYGNRYNTRSPENVVQEIAFLQQKYGTSHFWMCDDIFGLKPGWIQEFNQELKKKQLKISYKIQSRADLLVKEDTIMALSESGLREVWIGAESGSQKILDAMDKGTTTAQIKSATDQLQQLGVRVAYFIQFGYIGETEEDIALTLTMIKENKPDDIGVSVSYPLPGTVFYEKVKDDMKLKANWNDSDELAMLFAGTFNSKYYKTLHRYLHKIFRTSQGIQFLKQFVLMANWNSISWRTLLLLPINAVKARNYKSKLTRLSNKA
jgi:anaerobic magnesium-protoporphyrin IX monomethyl ester cyclase